MDYLIYAPFAGSDLYFVFFLGYYTRIADCEGVYRYRDGVLDVVIIPCYVERFILAGYAVPDAGLVDLSAGLDFEEGVRYYFQRLDLDSGRRRREIFVYVNSAVSMVRRSIAIDGDRFV